MKRIALFLTIMVLLSVGSFSPHYSAFSNEDGENVVIVTIYISVFDCEHGNAVPNVEVTLTDPLTGSEINSGTTDSDGKLMTWFVANLRKGEDAQKRALNTTIELSKPGSECVVRKFDEYVFTSTEFEATIEKDFCMKGCYKDWELYKEIDFPEDAMNGCVSLLRLSQERKCSESEVGKRISPPCTVSWNVGRAKLKRECALICSGGYGYQNWVDLRCGNSFREKR